GKELFSLQGHSDGVRAVAVTPDGGRVISGSYGGTLKVWDMASGRRVAVFTVDSPVWCCAVAPDGMTITAGDSLGKVHFLRLKASI
ncbi:hypothetical protein ICL16_40700, partial [Iningainema sp. BLCCT55]|nr:hypothetical protein [Iningainema tapete BLCC-T55]